MTMETLSLRTDNWSTIVAGVLALMDKFSTYFGLSFHIQYYWAEVHNNTRKKQQCRWLFYES